MKFLLVITILLWITSNEHVSGDYNLFWSIPDDLKNLNATCPPYDTCLERERSESLRSSNCHCLAVCSQLGTCCADSSYNFIKRSKITQTCRSVGGDSAYFMVDSCPPSDDQSSVWESLCHEEWNGEDDVMKIIPVTSIFSRITYKNYFCFRCHETTDDFLYWNINLGSSDYEFDETIDESKVTVHYDNHYNVWLAPLGIGNALIPVDIKVASPMEINSLPISCDPYVISHCSEQWNDKDVSDKCGAYMGTILISRNGSDFKYRNAHCALCNYEDLNLMYCRPSSSFAFGAKVPFSFTHLLDINRSDGDKVGKIQKCADNHLWDPYAKTCRKLTCALPGYVVKNGKCTPP